jgi:hypothetical protein
MKLTSFKKRYAEIKKKSEIWDEKAQNGMNNLIFNFAYLMPSVYILILGLLNWTTSDEPAIPGPILINLQLWYPIIFGVSIIIIILTYKFILPSCIAKFKQYGHQKTFFKFVLMFALLETITFAGLFWGIHSWLQTNRVAWAKTILIICIGWSQLLYIYQSKIPANYRFNLLFLIKYSKYRKNMESESSLN